MKTLTVIAALILFSTRVCAQAIPLDTPSTADSLIAKMPSPLIAPGSKDTVRLATGETREVYKTADEQARFPGSISAYLLENIAYPANAVRDSVTRKVIVRFIIDTDGTVREPQVHRSSGSAVLDAEAARVIRSMPKWMPAAVQGKAVATYFFLPVVFEVN